MSYPIHGRSTPAIHPRQEPDPIICAIVPPISLAATFVMDAVGEARAGYDYFGPPQDVDAGKIADLLP